MQEQHGENNGRHRLQISADGNRLDGQKTDGGKVKIAADSGIDQPQDQDGKPVRR